MSYSIRRKTKAEKVREWKAEKANYDAIKVRLAEARDGAVSASVSTAGGAQSYTKESAEALQKQLAVSARRLDVLWAALTGKPSPNRPRSGYVDFIS